MTATLETVKVRWEAVSGATGYSFYVDGVKVGGNAGANARTSNVVVPTGTHTLEVRAIPGGQKQRVSVQWASLPEPPPSGWTQVAQEGQSFTLAQPMEVRYGAGTTFSTPRVMTGQVACTNATFGDPAPGQSKVCQTRPTTDPPLPPNVARSEPSVGGVQP